ncbi:MAG: ATP-binding protein, partial [Anaerolineaceae bacterium]|nr:ATP-binding protein [Anaerolineaceae bacterium]
YLNNLFRNTYLKDVMERYDIRNDEEVLDDLLNIIASSIGALSNPSRLSNTFRSSKHKNVSSEAIKQYLTYFEEAYLIRKAKRYDVKGRKYIDTPLKYYFTDMGLRNSWLNYSQLEENHIMENIIYNELIMRGYSVDVGVVEYQYRDSEMKKTKVQLEVDFIARNAEDIFYIQSALHVDDEEKREQEINSFKRIRDSFTKVVIVRDHIMPYKDENGILFIGVKDCLLHDNF